MQNNIYKSSQHCFEAYAPYLNKNQTLATETERYQLSVPVFVKSNLGVNQKKNKSTKIFVHEMIYFLQKETINVNKQ